MYAKPHRAWREKIALALDADQIETDFIHSPSHRVNIMAGHKRRGQR